MNYTINNNYNDTNYIMIAIPQPPKVDRAYPSELDGYKCSSGTDTDRETHSDTDNDRVVIIDIVQ